MPLPESAEPMSRTLCRTCWEIFAAGLEPCPGCGSQRLITHPELEQLSIAHIDCDAFYASVEKRDRPSIRDRPLIVGHPGGRGVVTTACYIARTFGVHSAMPMFQALERCPQAVVIAPDMAKYKAVSSDIRAIFLSATPIIEPVSLDEAYLDLGEADRLSEPSAAQALARIATEIEAQVGITVSIGLSANKLLAKLASELEKPRGFSVIGAAEARSFLAGLSVSKINGVGAATAVRLEAAGIRSIADLQATSDMALITQFGKFGRRLAAFAIGEDDRPVTPDRETKSISAETTFRRDTAAPADLVETARPLCERVAAALVRKELAGGTLVLKLKTHDFRLITRNRKLGRPTQRASVLIEAAIPLIEREADGRHFRLIGIGVDQLVPAAEGDPPDLFGAS
jgi:DNA polymerase IV